MCGGRGHPPTAPSGRAVFLRGVEMGGRGRRVDGDPRGLVAGRAQDRHGRRRVRVVRGHEGVLTEEDGEVCARGGCGGVGCGDAAAAEGDGDAGGCLGLEGGNGAGGIAVAGVKVSCGGSPRTVSRQLSGRCAVVRMVATAVSSAACRCTASASQADPCTLPDDFAGWPRGVGKAAGSTSRVHVHRAPEEDLCPGGGGCA